MTSTKNNRYQKKIKLSKQNRRTRWAPVWVVIKKMGKGKKMHPSAVTHLKRHWRRTKLRIKPRRMNKNYLG
jgi:ribosomal protein L39E